MKCFICGEEVPLDFTQKVAWTSQGESVCCAIHSEEEIRNFLLRDKDCPYYRLIGENFEGKNMGIAMVLRMLHMYTAKAILFLVIIIISNKNLF